MSSLRSATADDTKRAHDALVAVKRGLERYTSESRVAVDNTTKSDPRELHASRSLTAPVYRQVPSSIGSGALASSPAIGRGRVRFFRRSIHFSRRILDAHRPFSSYTTYPQDRWEGGAGLS